MNRPSDITPEAQLERHRAEIDAIDDTLAELLRQRIEVVQQVAALKAEHWPGDCHIRPGREGRMHRRIAEKFKGSAFTPKAALALWRQLIGASTNSESPLIIAVGTPEHAALAREYFGPNTTIRLFSSISEVLGAVTARQCNLLLAGHDQLTHVAAASDDLFVFAQLPLVPDAHPPAYAIGRVAPEPSDDDISLYVVDGSLRVMDGFVTPHAANLGHARWLGAYPRAPKLD